MKIEKDTTISHYKILSEIGKGGMGEVYLAQYTKLNRKVAIELTLNFTGICERLNRLNWDGYVSFESSKSPFH